MEVDKGDNLKENEEYSENFDKIRLLIKRTHELFSSEYYFCLDIDNESSKKVKINYKIKNEYKNAQELPQAITNKYKNELLKKDLEKESIEEDKDESGSNKLIEKIISETLPNDDKNLVLLTRPLKSELSKHSSHVAKNTYNNTSSGAVRRKNVKPIKPEWHAPWKLMRVISGHFGWVRAVAVEPGNQWFVTGAGDRVIKIWDLASGTLKLSLTGHISTVRGLAVSSRHPYLFSCAEDKMIKCWDLETNKVIRHYHGSLSGVYCLSLHPTLDVLCTGGRDSVVRVWDMRTRNNVHVLSGHNQTVADVKCQNVDPQVISGSMDSTIRLWDLAAGKTMTVLTNHKKGVRALVLHEKEFSFASGSADNIKQWKFPEGLFMQNFEQHNAIINTLSLNSDDIMFSGADNGSMSFYDWKSGYKYQTLNTIVQPGSLESEAGIFASTFDRTGLRLITCEADKTIKVYKQDETATETTHPLDWKPTLSRKRY
ncbi:uncharacterized protein T551_01167 [Pneumocystis jirovecii RU7]|uniref:Pre-mRNA-splicing factor PRP46 n=1 Tax=Pneumocystis jirovecii (strain RU7) TaxID=1408657 RepID=A0A0W4ZU56_PNEJ7|nr:uncharacterized protein T551_01167 [Pneumocystis jirovecii RU7]KTW31906.1 hypothetical protein T551_01167 [Pneumocystis jirovecii RU7]